MKKKTSRRTFSTTRAKKTRGYDSAYEENASHSIKSIATQFGLLVDEQVRYELIGKAPGHRAKFWIVDFALRKDDLIIPIEVKGAWMLHADKALDLFRYKHHLFALRYPKEAENLIMYCDFEAKGLFRVASNYHELYQAITEILSNDFD